MIKIEEIEKLATLSRIALSADEKESIRKDIEGILGYVAQIKEVSAEMKDDGQEQQFSNFAKNVMRNDEVFTKGGEYSEVLLSSAPKREKNYVKVKKIL